MFRMNRVAVVSLALMITLWGATSVRAGGFYVSAESPDSETASKVPGAVLVVRPFGCHNPSDAVIRATAEGIAQGKRQTISLELVHVSTGVYAIKQQWPAQGSWVISINGKYSGATRSLLVVPGGAYKSGVKGDKATAKLKLDRDITSEEIDSTLKSMSTKS